MATKEASWEFIHETNRKKYFLVKQDDNEYFVFRTPKHSEVASKHDHTLGNWEGEIVPWGGVPAKVRRWLTRKKVKPEPTKAETLTIQT